MNSDQFEVSRQMSFINTIMQLFDPKLFLGLKEIPVPYYIRKLTLIKTKLLCLRLIEKVRAGSSTT